MAMSKNSGDSTTILVFVLLFLHTAYIFTLFNWLENCNT
jgi:hypothetical protein